METVVQGIANETHDGQKWQGKEKQKQRKRGEEEEKWEEEGGNEEIAALKGGSHVTRRPIAGGRQKSSAKPGKHELRP